ncbi:MAG: hypothetical protein U0797_26255 [Gemmataceae bacterium]
MSETLLTIRNRHGAGCGEPPAAANGPGAYTGYFENGRGEQWVFTRGRGAKTGELRGGDLGWGRRSVVRDGQAPGLILDGPEAAWLRACWQASAARG